MPFSERFLARDFIGGALFAALGVGITVISSGYPIGTATRMGPGYFPLMVAGLIVALGSILAVRALVTTAPQPRVPALALRPLLFVIVAIAVFAALIDDWGVIVAVAAMVAVARLSRLEGSLVEIAATIAVLACVAVLVFSYGLNMPLQIWPW